MCITDDDEVAEEAEEEGDEPEGIRNISSSVQTVRILILLRDHDIQKWCISNSIKMWEPLNIAKFHSLKIINVLKARNLINWHVKPGICNRLCQRSFYINKYP